VVEVPAIQQWLKSQDMTHLDESTIYNVSLVIEPREEEGSMGRAKGGSISRKNTKLKKGTVKDSKNHASWSPSTAPSFSPIPGKKTKNLQKFFGTEIMDVTLVESLTSQSNSVPKSILDDVDIEVPKQPISRDSDEIARPSTMLPIGEDGEFYEPQEKYVPYHGFNGSGSYDSGKDASEDLVNNYYDNSEPGWI
jgi:hypothetical protein